MAELEMIREILSSITGAGVGAFYAWLAYKMVKTVIVLLFLLLSGRYVIRFIRTIVVRENTIEDLKDENRKLDNELYECRKSLAGRG